MKKSLLFCAIACVTAVALAKVWGPFFIAAAGGRYANRDFATDQEQEWSGASTLAIIYMSPIMASGPLKIAEVAVKDFFRVVYADGQIVDFKIDKWGSEVPVTFVSKMPAANSPHLTQQQLDDRQTRIDACVPVSYNISYDTGYFGQSADYSDGGATVTVTAFYVNTGTVTSTIRAGARCEYR